jgi:hypothetical protein
MLFLINRVGIYGVFKFKGLFKQSQSFLNTTLPLSTWAKNGVCASISANINVVIGLTPVKT